MQAHDDLIVNRHVYCLTQGCPTCGPLKVLVRPSDDFQFSGCNEGYEKNSARLLKDILGRKSINKRRFLEKIFFLENI